MKGIGEIGLTATAAAIAQCRVQATGIRVRVLPITPDKFFQQPRPIDNSGQLARR
jgi:xanthine dehydrogenase YagR molybdenum-binding subunit